MSFHSIHDLERLKQGCTDALRRIFNQYYSKLVSTALTYVGDEQASKDIAQEVFLELWRRRHTLEVEPSLLGAYLHRATINRALNYLKAQRRYELYSDCSSWQTLPDASAQEVELKVHQDKLEAHLQEAIEKLPEKCRIVFMLSRFEQMSHREIAQRLNISVKTVENHIVRALRLLRQALAKQYYLPFLLLFLLK
ncbi:MAG: RNA polymerase sigma-70 factor [Saprospiraceae bacterium]|nr:RNA polymerase sigma-70 factor [Saprospiraceae bacterium]MDW8483549.1 RNA polymerase sigma-70 factor [Saprospiraceae bacterium]